jgi:hypothetical protein
MTANAPLHARPPVIGRHNVLDPDKPPLPSAAPFPLTGRGPLAATRHNCPCEISAEDRSRAHCGRAPPPARDE